MRIHRKKGIKQCLWDMVELDDTPKGIAHLDEISRRFRSIPCSSIVEKILTEAGNSLRDHVRLNKTKTNIRINRCPIIFDRCWIKFINKLLNSIYISNHFIVFTVRCFLYQYRARRSFKNHIIYHCLSKWIVVLSTNNYIYI